MKNEPRSIESSGKFWKGKVLQGKGPESSGKGRCCKRRAKKVLEREGKTIAEASIIKIMQFGDWGWPRFDPQNLKYTTNGDNSSSSSSSKQNSLVPDSEFWNSQVDSEVR